MNFPRRVLLFVLSVPLSLTAQLPTTPAREITLFDRTGNVLNVIGAKGVYQHPVFSPDGSKLAMIRNDTEKRNSDIWVFDIVSGNGTQISFNAMGEQAQTPVWSPDGNHVAYVARRQSVEGLYRKPVNGQGAEELLYQLPGIGMQLTDWSLDGRFLCYYSTQPSGSNVYALPMDGERKPIEILKSPSQIVSVRLSPDSRYLAYRSNESGANEVWVRVFDVSNNSASQQEKKWRISDQGGLGMISWRRDGRELYYLSTDRAVIAVPVTPAPDFEFGKPTLLFKAPNSLPITQPGTLGSVGGDGKRIVFTVPPNPRLRQVAIFDREGKMVSKVGEPALYVVAGFSPDGSHAVVRRNDQASRISGYWTSLPANSLESPTTGQRKTIRYGRATANTFITPPPAEPTRPFTGGPPTDPAAKRCCSATPQAPSWP